MVEGWLRGNRLGGCLWLRGNRLGGCEWLNAIVLISSYNDVYK